MTAITDPQRWMRLFGDEWCGNHDVPASHLALRVPMDDDYRVYGVGNDSFELWIGYSHEWRWHMDRSEARRLAWFILWRWFVVGEWFGLRRWLYYRALSASVRRIRRGGAA